VRYALSWRPPALFLGAGVLAAGMAVARDSAAATASFPAVIDLSVLNGTNGFVLYGTDAYDSSGVSVREAGDVNGDGIDDLLIGASMADPDGATRAGETYVVFGRTTGFPATFELRRLFVPPGGDASAGFVLKGVDAADGSGTSVSGAGDVNGDGIDDLLIGAFGASPDGQFYAGETYVVFGSTTGFPPALELQSLFPPAGGDGSAGFVVKGVHGADYSGRAVSGAGDVNGDGIDDLLIGAFNASRSDRFYVGESYVVFGRPMAFPATFELRSLFPSAGGDGSGGFVLKGVDAGDLSGSSVSDAGDVNGDGIDDVVIGAVRASPDGQFFAGESYVVFGRATGIPASFELRNLFPPAGGDGSTGFVIKGIDSSDYSGVSVSSAGDVNGDGIDDLLIGASGADPGGNTVAGESYVLFGRATRFPAVFELRSLRLQGGGDASVGFVLEGIGAGDSSGSSVSGAGDVNGDGIDDLLIGAPGADTSAGATYVVFGRTTGFPAVFELRHLLPSGGGDGSAGFVLKGVDFIDRSGYSVSGAGDVNGDGVDDLLIGARDASPGGRSHAGKSYVVFGRVGAPSSASRSPSW